MATHHTNEMNDTNASGESRESRDSGDSGDSGDPGAHGGDGIDGVDRVDGRADLGYSPRDVEVAREHLRRITATFPEVSERLSHGATTFFVRDKRVLCYLSDDHHGDGRLAVICAAPPGIQEELISAEPDRFYRPPYVGHRGWIGLRLDVTPDWNEVAALLDEAYRMVAPATLVRRLDEERATSRHSDEVVPPGR